MTPETIERYWRWQRDQGGPFVTPEEWADLFPAMWRHLTERAQRVPYGDLPTRYSAVGSAIGLPWIPDYDWWPLKMMFLLYATATFEHLHDRPMLTAIVVNERDNRPGNGFWTLPGIPSHIRMKVASIDALDAAPRDDRRDVFWVEELQRVSTFWRDPDKVANVLAHHCTKTCCPQ